MSLLDDMNKAGVVNKKTSLLGDMEKDNPLDGFSTFNKKNTQPKGVIEKTGSFANKYIAPIIGGGKLAEGIGGAIAAPEVRTSITESQKQIEDLQQKFLVRIREKKAKGEDTGALEKALND